MIAVIDCGTNTFNLLIAKLASDNSLETIYNGRIPVKLGEGGIDKNELSHAAFERGINALRSFHSLISTFPVTKTIAMGTAAIRDARNGQEFIDTCKKLTGINIESIDGNREAELIWLAAKHCVNPTGRFLVMDIGGGSNEFVIGNEKELMWKKSFRLGLSRLKETFKLEDNPAKESVLSIEEYLKDQMRELFEACRKFETHYLIGTAGTFDTYANVFSIEETGKEFDFTNKTYEFSKDKLISFCQKFMFLSYDERNAVAGIPDFRKEFMVYACILTKVVMENCAIKTSSLSAYALKEGVFLNAYTK